MRVTASIAVCVLALTACGERQDTHVVGEEMAAPARLDVAAPPQSLSVEDACRKAVEILYGQSGDAVKFDLGGLLVSWPAPVDGGELVFNCSVQGDEVTLMNDDRTVSVSVSSAQAAQMLSAQEKAR